MQARGPLMVEHRLIERMLSSVENALAQIESTHWVDPLIVDTAVDCIRTYADRTHHGKEKGILFKELSAREHSAEDRRVMDELVADHVFGRTTTDALAEANELFRHGESSALTVIVRQLRTLCDFYPRHIEKEDKVFFAAARAYLTGEEDQAMLARFWEFDQTMIHEKYKSVVEGRLSFQVHLLAQPPSLRHQISWAHSSEGSRKSPEQGATSQTSICSAEPSAPPSPIAPFLAPTLLLGRCRCRSSGNGLVE